MTVYRTDSEKETLKLGERLAKDAFPGQIITLDGELGCGKTVFAKGFAKGLGIEEPVTSPTFTIVQTYETGRLPLYHFDVYRIEEPEEMYECGMDEYLFSDGVCIIEWAKNIAPVLPNDVLGIEIKRDEKTGDESRIIEITDKIAEHEI